MSLPHPDNISASGVTRRTVISSALAAAGGALAFPQSVCLAGQPAPQETRRAAPKRYDMKKSINLWAFPYPDRMNLRECLQLAKDAGFDARRVELRLR